ncbi:MAG: hypothetical protein ABIK07_14790 [Planctomycetota bacterium]
MKDLVWIGGAPAVAQVDTITLPSDIEGGQIFKATIGRKTLPYTFPDGPLRVEAVAAIVDLWNDSEIPEFAEIAAADNGDGSFTLTANNPGKPFIVSFVIGNGTNEIQTITLLGSPTGGSFTLDFDGQVTGNIALDASAATLQTALEALPNIDPGDVSVSGADGGPWTVEFQGNLSDTDVALLLADDTLLEGINEEQVITLASASGGTFTASFGGQTTGPIAFDASAGTFQTALEGLSTIGVGNVSVTGPAGGPWTVEFQADLKGTDVALITVDGSNLTGKLNASIVETTPGGGGSNERHIIQAHVADWGSDQNGRIAIGGNAAVTGGTWDLTISNAVQAFVTLTDIPYDVTIAELQALIDAALIAWGSNVEYRVFVAHIFTSAPVGNMKFSDGGLTYWQVDSASGQTGLAVDVDSTNLTGDTYSGFVGNELYMGDTSDYGHSSGSWKLLIDGNATDDLSPTISAADLKTAIEGIAAVGAGNVAVYAMGEGGGFQYGGGFVIEFIGDLSNQATGFTITTSKSAGSTLNLQVWTGYLGDSGTGEVQTLSITGGPGSGTFGLRFGGDDTVLLDYDSTAEEIETALEALDSIGTGNVACTGGALPGSAVVITFSNALGGEDLDEIEVIFGTTVETVTGGGLPSVEIKTTQTKVGHANTVVNEGPNDWNTLTNWDLVDLPADDDNAFIVDGSDILYGLDQSDVTLNRLEILNSALQIGLPRRNDNYYEYLDRFLKIGAAQIMIGRGEGNDSARINLDIGTTSPLIEIYDSGTGQDGEPAIQIIGVNAVNTAELLVLGGEVGVARLPKEAAYFSKVTLRDGELTTGSDVTIGELISTGGTFRSDRTTVNGAATL